jgi:hypothetical protein
MNTFFTRRSNAPGEMPDRVESELARWLCELEPAGTPVALRLRAYADLRAEVDSPRPRLPWLRPAFSAFGSLGSVVVIAGLVLLLTMAGNSNLAGGGAGTLPGLSAPPTPPPADTTGNGPDPIAVMLLVAAAIAGMTVYLSPVQRLVRRATTPKGRPAPLAPLAVRRSWRAVSPVAWALGAMAVVLWAWGLQRFLLQDPGITGVLIGPIFFVAGLSSLAASAVALAIPFAVAWRYPLRDWSARLMLFGALAAICDTVFYSTMAIVGRSLGPSDLPMLGIPALWMLGVALLTAGIASRQGSVRRPPLRLTAVVVGATFAMTTSVMYLNYDLRWVPLSPYLIEAMLATLSEWTSRVAWLAILWLGITAWNTGRGRLGWKLVLLAGALNLASHLPGDISLLLHQFVSIVPNVSMRGPFESMVEFAPGAPALSIEYLWQVVAPIGSSAALLLALVVGLRPVPANRPATIGPGTAGGETTGADAAAAAEPGAAEPGAAEPGAAGTSVFGPPS